MTTAEFHDRIRHSFAPTNILELEYERPLREPHLWLERVWEFLGLPVRPVSGRVKLQRQEVRPLDQTVENFDESCRQFKERHDARYFEALDAWEWPSIPRRLRSNAPWWKLLKSSGTNRWVTSEGAASRISMHDWMTGWVPSTLLLLITLSRIEMSRERRHATSAGSSLALLAQIY